jgi:hypothetical protein
MNLKSLTVMLILLSIYMAISVSAMVILNNVVSPHAAFLYMVVSTVVTSFISFNISIDIPE